jgi:A/G-specific adenine glycosylase
MNALPKAEQFNRTLFRWFRKNGRQLPWRKTTSPYRILVSEVMLQQTQVERVLPKYALFLRRFPTVHKLAESSLADVLRVWSGLGYNRRAKYLWECAREIVRKHKSTFSSDVKTLLALPGIGPSTAAALLAFAFGKDEPVVDTNVHRVLCRIFFPSGIPSNERLREFAKTLIPKGMGKEWNWAVMDMGALLCRARSHMAHCPLQKLHGPVSNFTNKKPQTNFKGSQRYWRGKIIALLVAAPKGYASGELRHRLGLNRKDFGAIIAALKKERLIQKTGALLRIP